MRRASLPALACALAAAGCGGTSHGTTPAPEGVWRPALTLPAPAPPQRAEAVERPDGSAIAVWGQRLHGSATRILAAERSPEGVWSAGAPVAPDSPTPIQGVKVVVDPAGVATAVWAVWDRPAGTVFAFVQSARRGPDGTWGPAVTLSRGTNGLFDVAAAAPAPGRVVVAWSGSERRNGAYFPEVKSAFRSPGGTWRFATVAGRLKGDPTLDRGSLGAIGSTGRVRLAWISTRARGFAGGVLTAVADPAGRWSPPRRISDEGERPTNFRVASADDGSMVAAWTREGTGVARVARAVGAGWSAPRTLPGGRVEDSPTVLAGPRASALVALQRRRGGRSLLQTVAITADGSPDRPRTVAARDVPPSVAGTERHPIGWEPALARQSDGRVLIAWSRQRARDDGVVVADAIAARVAPALTRPWGPLETVVTFSTPLVGVVPAADGLPDGRFEARWSERVDGRTDTEQSIRAR